MKKNTPRQAVIALVATCGYLTLFGAEAPSPTEPTLELPKVKVSADVPLLKTADYHMLTARAAAATVVRGQYIFVIGGLGPDGELLKSIERFDTRTGKAEKFGELHAARMWHRAVVISNRAYIIGGQYFVSSLPSDKLDKMPVNPRPRPTNEAAERARDYQARMSEAMSQIYGDTSENGSSGRIQKFQATIEILDLTTGKVEIGGEMPDPRAEFGCVAMGTDIYIIGGKHLVKGRLAFTSRTNIWDSVTRKWRDGVALPATIVCDAAMVDGSFIVVAGGYTGSKKLDAVYAFNVRTNAWNAVRPLCRPTSAQSTVFLDKYLFLFGDYDSPEEILAYNLQSKSSALFTVQYIPARHASAISCDGKIYVFGGKRLRTSAPLDNIQQFELTKNITAK